MRLSLLLLSIIGLFDGVKGQVQGCDDDCKLQDDMQNNPLVKCGKVIGEHPIYGKKCVYLTKTRLVQYANMPTSHCSSENPVSTPGKPPAKPRFPQQLF